MITLTKTNEHGCRTQIELSYISKAQPRSTYLLIAYVEQLENRESKLVPVIVQYDPQHEQDAITQFRQYIYWEFGDIIIPEVTTYKLTGGLTPHSPKRFSEVRP